MKTLYKAILISLVFSTSAHAGFWDWLTGKSEEIVDAVKSGDTSKMVEVAFTNEQIANGLKQALSKGADYAVDELGKPGGFLNDPNIKIPMPKQLSAIEDILRKTGQDEYADQFVNTLNSAAEQAVPLSLEVLKTGIKNITVEDAKNILNGADDAATQYLIRVGSPSLKEKIRPIVQKATAQTGITKLYKQIYDKLGFAGKYLNLENYDIDEYVTKKTMDGLFVKIAEEEKKIRDNPSARTTEVLKQVFGAQIQ